MSFQIENDEVEAIEVNSNLAKMTAAEMVLHHYMQKPGTPLHTGMVERAAQYFPTEEPNDETLCRLFIAASDFCGQVIFMAENSYSSVSKKLSSQNSTVFASFL